MKKRDYFIFTSVKTTIGNIQNLFGLLVPKILNYISLFRALIN